MANAATGNSQPVVTEVVGPQIPARQAAAAIALGVIPLLIAGVTASVLGQLADEHRIATQSIGIIATVEGLTMGIATAIASAMFPPRHLRLIGVIASVVLGVVDVATMGAHAQAIIVLRTLAGIPEGVLLWITVGMIARSAVPARWAGVFLTAITASQFVLSLSYTWIIPRFGADGAFAALAVTAFGGVAFSLFAPRSYAPLPKPEGESGLPPRRGWIALFGSLLILAAIGAVGVYLQPLAHEAGLSGDVARTAVSASLAFQIAGGSVATLLASRLHYFPAFIISAVGFFAGWIVFAFHAPAYLFVLGNSLAGFMTLFVGPFIVPMTIEADPTLRAAVQSAAAQVLGGALGPLAASFMVGARDAHGSVYLAIALMAAGTAIVGVLHATALRERRRATLENTSGSYAGNVGFQGAGSAPVTIRADQARDDPGHQGVAQ